uniref:CRC domain-containing protein n=1 Tax=Anopheles minimus TaxID=112268 RepID=A0A182W8A0_9DIPT
MEDLRDIEDGPYNDSQDLVEYTTEDEPDELDHGTMSIDLEDLVEESNHPEVSTDEEYENYEDDEKPSMIQLHDSSKTMQTMKNTVSISGLQNIGISSVTDRASPKVVMVPHSTVAPTTTTPMKLLNTARASLPSTMATTSYRLLNSEGTMIVNVSNKPTAVKKIISVSNPATSQNPANRVVLNTKAQVVHIQPQTIPTISGTSLKTMKTITMTTNPGSSIKMVPQKTPLPSGLQGTVLRMTKPAATQAIPLAGTNKITKINPNNGGSEMPKVILKPAIPNTGAKRIIGPAGGPLHAVTLPGGKGIQYVRLLNQRPAATAVQKIVMQTPGKTANISSSAAPNVGIASGATINNGGIQPGSSKIVMPNNRTFVIRNGSTHMTGMPTSTATIGKPSILPVGRKIILNSDGNTGATRIVLAKEAGKKLNTIQTVVQKSLLPSNGAPSTEDGGGGAHMVVHKQEPLVAEPAKANVNHPTQLNVSTVKGSPEDAAKDVSRVLATSSYGFPEEAYKKRPCNCTKSQCLKLYCDCFANGEYCYNCNCKDCFNTFDHASERQKAVRSTLERNPNAFKPKIGSIGSTDDGMRLHTKGCNCKRSGCLKNYCECYEGKIPCSSNCKCIGCRNTENFDMVYDYYSSNDASTKSVEEGSNSNVLIIPDKVETVDRANRRSSTEVAGLKRSASYLDTDLSQLPPTKQPHNFMTMDVIEATVQCMVAQADECMKRGCSMRTSELMILEEYGRCLLEIKDFAYNTEN